MGLIIIKRGIFCSTLEITELKIFVGRREGG